MSTAVTREDHDDDDGVQLVPTGAKADDPSWRLEPEDDRPPIGSWWWVDSSKEDGRESDYDEPGKKWIACVIEVGSNYVKVEGVYFSSRIALDNFHARCKPEGNPDTYIAGKIGFHKTQVRALMGEIQQICHKLGVPVRQAIAAAASPTAETSQALAIVHGVDDVKNYSKALVKAKDKTLPELFEKVKRQHEAMAKWMKADLIPAHADLEATKEVIEVLEGKIHTVELYGGLNEKLEQVREGDPATIDTRLHIMQRRHYMDEECLAQYEAGGMDFQSIGKFDKWLARDENFGRLFPHARTIVAFRVRRNDKEYGGAVDTLANFIRFGEFNRANKWTFLYIRNGQQLWRMSTSIDFDEELFASRADSDLIGNHELWIKQSEYDLRHSEGIITSKARDAMLVRYRQKRSTFARRLWQWHEAGKPEGEWQYVAGHHEPYSYLTPGSFHPLTGRPTRWSADLRNAAEGYVHLTPHSIFYDDAMKQIQKTAMKQNRLAVVIQGLLDRSTCLHPHPPWRIWTPDGFAAGIELVFDVARVLVAGEAPDFESYRQQLNKSLRVGSSTIGQRGAWTVAMAKQHGTNWRSMAVTGDGPKRIDIVAKMWRDGSCDYAFTRDRMKPIWVDSERPGYIKKAWPEIAMTWRCPSAAIMCIDAYTPGDFHLFFDDPRTRQDYLKWAPFLLAAEDWHHANKNAPSSKKAKKDRSAKWDFEEE